MNIAEIFVRRPVMTVLVMTGILIFGVISYRLLPVNALPNVDFPTIQVQAQLPGASPDTMASAVATPLEKQFSTIAGIDSMTSSSTDGITTITMQFSLVAASTRRRTCSRRSPPRRARALVMPNPPHAAQGHPATRLSLASSCVGDDALSTVDDYAENLLAQPSLDDPTASRRSPSTGRSSTRCASSSTRTPWRPVASR
jgi:HAE1 family hydrophobic/amphiphilic exporter-1